MGPADKGHSPFPSSERAVYGFALWLASFLLLGVFLLWAFLPDAWLQTMGLTYLPQKYWAVAIPSYVGVAVVVGVVSYAGLNLIMVPPLSDPRTVTDPHPHLPPSSPSNCASIPPLYDIPISVVNTQLYPTHTHLKHGRTVPA